MKLEFFDLGLCYGKKPTWRNKEEGFKEKMPP